MQTFQSHTHIRQFLSQERCNGAKIGLIPTMGALHDGHLSLVRLSKQEGDMTVATIFVNPTQFNKTEDLEKYPRNLDRDLDLLRSAGCDAVFVPSVEEMYPEPATLKISFGSLENELEGRFRPGHFAGVGLIVSKLFNLIQPDQAYFGQKDLQQFYVIDKLVKQLSFPIQLHRVPTARETSGLAMSSRNERLSSVDREHAALIYQALSRAKTMLLQGASVDATKQQVLELFKTSDRLELEYFEVIGTNDFLPLKNITDKATTALCLAAEIGHVRLIDNLLLIS